MSINGSLQEGSCDHRSSASRYADDGDHFVRFGIEPPEEVRPGTLADYQTGKQDKGIKEAVRRNDPATHPDTRLALPRSKKTKDSVARERACDQLELNASRISGGPAIAAPPA
ncbi:hypothetical protein [Bosea sp. 117]|uniref:hypothetical protein n=1 Tax=Bosea sp. 117 TaxID=1125973 RepID=UPI0020C0DC69|nr:hypothetical protein [Bosea sp. 117]